MYKVMTPGPRYYRCKQTLLLVYGLEWRACILRPGVHKEIIATRQQAVSNSASLCHSQQARHIRLVAKLQRQASRLKVPADSTGPTARLLVRSFYRLLRRVKKHRAHYPHADSSFHRK